jgi:hypothetical protein
MNTSVLAGRRLPWSLAWVAYEIAAATEHRRNGTPPQRNTAATEHRGNGTPRQPRLNPRIAAFVAGIGPLVAKTWRKPAGQP